MGQGKFQMMVVSGVYCLLVDELEVVGGLDSGLLFYDYLFVVFGICIVMILCMYVDCKGFFVDWIGMWVLYGKVYVVDCVDCVEDVKVCGGWIDWFEWVIILEGDLDEVIWLCMLEIVDKCFVYCMLEVGVVVVICEVQVGDV